MQLVNLQKKGREYQEPCVDSCNKYTRGGELPIFQDIYLQEGSF
jgi:hypothetical protein